MADGRSLQMASAPLRILVFGLPPLLDDLVRQALDGQGDVAMAAGTGELARAIADDRPDAVVVSMTASGLVDEAQRLLDQWMRPIVAIGLTDGRLLLLELRPRRSEFAEIAPKDLPKILRATLRRRDER